MICTLFQRYTLARNDISCIPSYFFRLLLCLCWRRALVYLFPLFDVPQEKKLIKSLLKADLSMHQVKYQFVKFINISIQVEKEKKKSKQQILNTHQAIISSNSNYVQPPPTPTQYCLQCARRKYTLLLLNWVRYAQVQRRRPRKRRL